MTDPFCEQGWVLKGHGISLFYHGKVIEKSWNLKAQKEHVPCRMYVLISCMHHDQILNSIIIMMYFRNKCRVRTNAQLQYFH